MFIVRTKKLNYLQLINPALKLDRSYFNSENLAHPSCQHPGERVESGLIFHGFHNRSASFME